MIVITDIRTTRRGRMALFGDGEFLFSLDEETLAKSGVGIGHRLDDAELAALAEDGETRKASDSALRYLSLRAYGEMELYRKLLLKYDEHTSAAAVGKMKELDLLCDETFAAAKAEGMAQRGKSPLEIKRKLLSLGIDAQLAENALSSLQLDGVQAALAVVRKKYIEKLQNGDIEKVKAALARRGFSHQEIRRALELALADNSEE